MAQGIYKSGEQINLVYQAANILSGAIPVGTVFDEAGAYDATKSTSLTSQLLLGEKTGVAAGRYHGHFTPDAEGRWTVVIQDKNGAGEVSKTYDVTGYNIDALGDAQVAMESAIVSQLLLTKSAIVSSVLVDLATIQSGIISNLVSGVELDVSDVKSAVIAGESGVVSQLLLTKSAIVSSILADLQTVAASQTLLMISAISDVESAVDLIAGAAMVS